MFKIQIKNRNLKHSTYTLVQSRNLFPVYDAPLELDLNIHPHLDYRFSSLDPLIVRIQATLCIVLYHKKKRGSPVIRSAPIACNINSTSKRINDGFVSRLENWTNPSAPLAREASVPLWFVNKASMERWDGSGMAGEEDGESVTQGLIHHDPQQI